MNIVIFVCLQYLIINETFSDKTIVLFNYNSYGFLNNSLYINNIKYRETCIQSNQNGIFALELNPGTYTFETKYNTLEINLLIILQLNQIIMN